MITFYRPSEPPEFHRISFEDVCFPVLNDAFGAFMAEALVWILGHKKQVNTDME